MSVDASGNATNSYCPSLFPALTKNWLAEALRSIVAANINTTEEELDQLIEDNRLVEISRFYQENGDSETAD